MTIPVVTLERTSEDDDRRTYSVGELVAGLSVSVVAQKEGPCKWSFQCEADSRISSSEQNDAIVLVSNRIEVEQNQAQSGEELRKQVELAQVEAEASDLLPQPKPSKVRKSRTKPAVEV